MSGRILDTKVYLAVFGGLMALTALTTAVAYIDLGAWNTVIAIGIAMAKMLLVVLYFMHARFSSTLVKVFALAGVYWLIILFGFTMSDYFTRLPVPGWLG